jgi:hypothetical protein
MNEPTDIDQGVALAPRTGVNRRMFLAIGGSVSAAAIIAACSSSDDDASDETTTTEAEATTTSEAETTTTTEAGPERSEENDLVLGAFAASLEVLAVGTYGAALDAAGQGALGEVPPAVAEFATTAQAQHQAHLDRWNEILTGAGMDEVTEPPADLKATIDEKFGEVTDAEGAARLALELEQIAAATYLSVIPLLATEAPIRLAASIQPIDMQHAAVLLFALGEYPVPDTFATTDLAVSP